MRLAPTLAERADFCFNINLLVFAISVFCHVVEGTNLDDVYVVERKLKVNQIVAT